MAKRVNGIEIVGLENLRKAFEGMPKEVEATAIRAIARKPAARIVTLARKLFKFKKSGFTKRSFAILKVQNLKQMFVEVGIKGRSLAWIFMQGAWSREKKSGASTGDITPIGNVIQEAAGSLESTVKKEMSVNISKVIAKAWRRYGNKK